MAVLFSTKYPNNSRIISGTSNTINKDDTVLLCNTSSGAVSITIGEIPSGYWDTNYKLYVSDYSNNAGTNNITINAPTGFTINNASSLVINLNGGSVLIQIASSTAYVGSLNYCCNRKEINYYDVIASLNTTITAPQNNTDIYLSSLLVTLTGETSSAGNRYLINVNVPSIAITTNPSANNGSILLKSVITDSADVVLETRVQQLIILNGYTIVSCLSYMALNWMPSTLLKNGYKIKTYINVASAGNDVVVGIVSTQTTPSQVTAIRTKLL
jgi:hypothetical protein